jgi:hypothetical protein
MMQDVHVTLNPGLSRQKQHSTRRRLFTSKLEEETSEVLHLEHCMMLKLGHFGKQIRIAWKFVKRGDGEDRLDRLCQK